MRILAVIENGLRIGKTSVYSEFEIIGNGKIHTIDKRDIANEM